MHVTWKILKNKTAEIAQNGRVCTKQQQKWNNTFFVLLLVTQKPNVRAPLSTFSFLVRWKLVHCYEVTVSLILLRGGLIDQVSKVRQHNSLGPGSFCAHGHNSK